MIRFVTDSASDMIDVKGVTSVPLQVHINDHDYHDGVDLDRDTFYQMLVSSSEFPKTSQPSPQDFLAPFEEAKEAGDDVICILIAGSLSGTFQSANIAKNIVEYDRIHLIDSNTTTYGARLLVENAMKMAENGSSVEEIVEATEKLKDRVRIYASVDTLDYLCKGGRLSATSAAIGNLAKLKPIITLNKEGNVAVLGKKIGMRKTISFIADSVCEHTPDQNYPMYLIYTYGTVNASSLQERLTSLDFKVTEPTQIGPTIGSHVGPEAFGIIYIEKEAE